MRTVVNILLVLLISLLLVAGPGISAEQIDVAEQRVMLLARQDVNLTNTAATSSVTPTPTSSADSPQNTCSLTTKLSLNQQASWGKGLVNTCCSGPKGSVCYIRVQSSVSPSTACQIPDCSDLESNDPARMAGFTPLTTTDGQGNKSNFYPSFSSATLTASLSPLPVAILSLLSMAAIYMV